MIYLSGGPADAVRLMLRRSPAFLRVTIKGKDFDALDQLNDSPRPGETVVAYKFDHYIEPRRYHLRMCRGGSGWFVGAGYVYLPEQPAADVLIDTTLWRKWCMESFERYFPGYKPTIETEL